MLKVGDKVRIMGPKGNNGKWYAGSTSKMTRAWIEDKVRTVEALHPYREYGCAVVSGLTEWFGVHELKK